MADYINRIRKQALTDEEVLQVSLQNSAHPEDTTEMEQRLRALMNEAVPLVDDTKEFDQNLQKLKDTFEPRGIAVLGKVLHSKKVNLNEQVDYDYKGSKVQYPKEYKEEEVLPEGALPAILSEYEISLVTKDGAVNLNVIPPNYPRDPNASVPEQKSLD